ERPLLAYDGSQRASAAMESAAEFCTVLRLPLTILTVTKEEQKAASILQEAKSYLSSYSIETRYETDRGYPEQRIVDYLVKFEYDLLFIGAYGHRRIIEMGLGSTTEYVLRKSPCPVFLNRYAHAESDPLKFLADAVQMLASRQYAVNLDEARRWIRTAASQGARVIVLPEVFIWRGNK